MSRKPYVAGGVGELRQNVKDCFHEVQVLSSKNARLTNMLGRIIGLAKRTSNGISWEMEQLMNEARALLEESTR